MKESVKTRKKLIEVALPLEAINFASAREKSIRHAHPSSLHLWWARRPLASARAVIFAQMVDDPSAHPELFPTEKAQDKERKRLFKIIEDLVQWENTTNPEVIERARAEIWQSWRSTCADNVDHPRAKDLFNRQKLPAFHDPFAGGGTIPLEAQRLGLDSYASDLNPVPVLINKAMIEIPPSFAGMEPVNPEWQRHSVQDREMRQWQGAQGLAEDVRYYGQWMRQEAEKRIGHLYKPVLITEDMVLDRPDLRPYMGKSLNVIAWLWARTVKSPNPAFSHVDVPLASTFMLSTKKGNEAYVVPTITGDHYSFQVRVGVPKNPEQAKAGTKLSRGANFRCIISDVPVTGDYIKAEGKAGRMGARMLAAIADTPNGRIYLPPSQEMRAAVEQAKPLWRPDIDFFQQALGFRVGNYGMSKWSDLFTDRQLIMLTTYADLVQEAAALVKRDMLSEGLVEKASNDRTFEGDYPTAVAVYLGLGASKLSDYNASLVQWSTSRDQAVHVFGRHALPMVWDYAEVNPFARAAGDFSISIGGIAKTLEAIVAGKPGHVFSADAQRQNISVDKCVCTDPPYYDNIGYADLSDFFYVWLRRSLKPLLPDIFATVTVPKANELVATPDRHGGREEAEQYFLDGMTLTLERLADQAHPAFPLTIFYAFKQSESDGDEGSVSTGWETFLDALIRAGFEVQGTWPMRTEKPGRMRENNSNALASSVVLVCRRRSPEAIDATRRNFVESLKDNLGQALGHLQRGNIAPVDLAQAAIGPGMGVFSQFARVLDAQGKPLSVRQALAIINELLDELLAEQEGDFDADTRWALTWFEQFGFAESEYGRAETLANARNTSVEGMKQAGILTYKAGKVRLLKPDELPQNWDPRLDVRLTAWEIVHHLVRTISAGEATAAALAAKLGPKAEIGRELAYRLYNICERKKRPQDAMSYNGLVQSWPEILQLARLTVAASPVETQSALFTEMV